MASFTGSALKDVYKDILHTSNSNTGLSTTIKQITCGDGDGTSLYLSTRNAKVQPASDTTTNTVIYDADGNALLTVDSTNDLVKAGIGQHTANTQFKQFGMYDFTPVAGSHYQMITAPIMYESAIWSDAVNGSVWGGNGTNPSTSLTISNNSLNFIPCVWLLQQNITIDEIQYIISAEGSTTINIHVMSYSMVTGSGSTAGDLTSGAVLAQTGSNSSSLSPVAVGDDRASNGTLTINTADVDDGKAIVVFFENVGGTDDVTTQVNLKYHLR
tara:strand:+ start:1958 stop:2770 length:813 start_codon:yes stop_codon:yes gene_type:complete